MNKEGTSLNNIHTLRKEKHISQTRLSIELEVSQETISAYENDKHYPSVKSLLKLRELFGVSIDYILGLTDQRYDSIQKSDLTEEEVTVLHTYRKMDDVAKEHIKAYMDGYLASR